MKTNRKFVCLLLLCSITSTAQVVQTDRGRWQVALQLSNLSYQSTSSTNFISSAGTLTPSVGYFFVKNLLVGVGIPLSISTIKSPNAFNDTKSGIGFAPFFQYYIGSAILKPYVGASYSYSFDNYKFRYENPRSTYSKEGTSNAFIPTIGLAYFVNQNVALNAGIVYSVSTVELNGPTVTTPTVIIEASKSEVRSLSLSFGVQVAIGR